MVAKRRQDRAGEIPTMSRATFRPLNALALIALLMFSARPTFACGPFSLDAVFTFTVHPEFPLEKFAAGQIGVVQGVVGSATESSGNWPSAADQRLSTSRKTERV